MRSHIRWNENAPPAVPEESQGLVLTIVAGSIPHLILEQTSASALVFLAATRIEDDFEATGQWPADVAERNSQSIASWLLRSVACCRAVATSQVYHAFFPLCLQPIGPCSWRKRCKFLWRAWVSSWSGPCSSWRPREQISGCGAGKDLFLPTFRLQRTDLKFITKLLQRVGTIQ